MTTPTHDHDNVTSIDDAEDIAWLNQRRRVLQYRKETDATGRRPGFHRQNSYREPRMI